MYNITIIDNFGNYEYNSIVINMYKTYRKDMNWLSEGEKNFVITLMVRNNWRNGRMYGFVC